MSDTTDPANARLALRRLVSGLLQVNPERRIDGDASIDDLLGVLDSDELADYEQVLDRLRAQDAGRRRFAVFGVDVVDLDQAIDVHGTGIVRKVATAQTGPLACALADLLNAHPDEWAGLLLQQEGPF